MSPAAPAKVSKSKSRAARRKKAKELGFAKGFKAGEKERRTIRLVPVEAQLSSQRPVSASLQASPASQALQVELPALPSCSKMQAPAGSLRAEQASQVELPDLLNTSTLMAIGRISSQSSSGCD